MRPTSLADMTKYLFTSERLGFRAYTPDDIDPISAMNADEAVMQFFDKPMTTAETLEFIKRQDQQLQLYGYCFFVVEHLESKLILGSIGLGYRDYPSPMSPFVDVGWRLKRSEWGKGYATEGAMACIAFGFSKGIHEIYAITPVINKPSQKVMQKCGMKYYGHFDYPFLSSDHRLNPHIIYKIQA
jgi:[ribosomal protein S5]-alanine N-acetyltransferase